MKIQVLQLALIFPLLVACSHRHESLGRTKATEPALHAIQDLQLRELMAEMNSLVLSEKELTETQRDYQRQEYKLKIASSAKIIANNATLIKAELPKLNLSETEQATFLAMADRLRSQATAIENLSANNHSDSIPYELEKLTVTCNACHRLFRLSGG